MYQFGACPKVALSRNNAMNSPYLNLHQTLRASGHSNWPQTRKTTKGFRRGLLT